LFERVLTLCSATSVGLMDSPAKEGQLAPKKKGKRTKKLGGSGRGSNGPRLAEALADNNSTNGELAATPAKSGKSGKGGKSATPAAEPAAPPAAPPKPVFQGTIGFLAPEKAMCRCVESPLVRGMRLNVSRIVLAFWTAEAKKSIKVKAALKKMTPEGRAQSGAFRAWYAKLLEHRRMKACAAKMSPEGRAKGAAFAKWINDQRASRLKVVWLTGCPCGHLALQMPRRSGLPRRPNLTARDAGATLRRRSGQGAVLGGSALPTGEAGLRGAATGCRHGMPLLGAQPRPRLLGPATASAGR
jgi:hypothetical protein